MKFVNISRWLPVVAFTGALVFAFVTVFLFHQQWWAREKARDRLALDVEALVQRRTQNEEAIKLYDRLVPRYEQAADRGWWRPQERLAWLESVRDTARAAGVVRLRYTLSPPRWLEDAGGFGVRSVAVELEMDLVHGGQLLGLSRALERLGPFSWERCEIERRPEPPEPAAPNLAAVCRLEWLAIVDRPADEADGDFADDGLDAI